MNYLQTLRIWWQLLDAVELEAAQAGQPMSRVEDVRQLTEIHASYGRGDTGRPPISRVQFGIFKRLANAILRDLGAPELHWVGAEDAPIRSLPSDIESRELRIRLKQEWDMLRHFSRVDQQQ